MRQKQESKEPISLGRGGTLRIPGGEGTLVCVWEGEVWLTEDGDREDHILTAGQRYRLTRPGAIAQAFRHSVLSLSVTQAAPNGLRRWLAAAMLPRWA